MSQPDTMASGRRARHSASTPRLRLTLLWFLALLALASVAGRPPLEPAADRAVAALALLLVASAVLGRIWCSAFIAGRKDAELVREGPYSLCRHPLYLLSLLGTAGIGLATRSVVLTLLTLGLLLLLLRRAMRAEEVHLARTHGAAYEAYARATPRLWPRPGAWHLPERLELRPRVYCKAFLDGGAFLVLYAAVDTARALREAGVLPTLLTLY